MSLCSKTVADNKGNNMTTYYARGHVLWLNYYVEGKRFRKSTNLQDTPQNIKIVETQMIPSLNIKISTGDIYKKKPKNFGYYADIFLGEKCDNKSYFHKHAYYQRVIKHFGHYSIDTITRLDIKKYLSSLKMQSNSKNTYKSCLKEIFEYAVDDNIISSNPVLNIRFKSEEKKEIQYFTRDEVDKILSVASGIMKPYLHIAFNTGMRVGEILGLQLGDFKDDGFIHIKRTRTKGILGNGKTNNAIRKVPYPKYILEEVKKIQGDNIFVFGSFDDATKLRRKWEAVLRESGVEHKKLSSTRHTFATLMLKENIVSINELAGLLGHSRAKTTLEHYASVIQAKNIDLGVDFSLFGRGHNTVTISNQQIDRALK